MLYIFAEFIVNLGLRDKNLEILSILSLVLSAHFSGVRVEHTDGHTSNATGRFGDWPRLHFRYS